MATQKVLILDPTTNRPKQLTPNVSSAGAADAGKLVALNGSGVLDSTMLPAGSGGSLSLTSSENLAAGALVNIDSSGSVRNANATDATKPAMGFVLAATTTPAAATVYFVGQVNSGASGLTVGGAVYLSASSAGASTSSAPSATGNLVQRVGIAISATEYAFTPDSGIIA
jgi:hypothetical protein